MRHVGKRLLGGIGAAVFALSLSIGGGATTVDAVESPTDQQPRSVQEISGTFNNGITTFTSEGSSSLSVLPPSGVVPSDLEALAASISCTLNVQNVHASTHKDGTINGVARINCTAPAGSLQIHYSLIRMSPYTQWGGPSRTNGGYTFIQTNRAVDCDQGPASFRGWAQGFIAPPPGYTLVGPASASAYGNIVSVGCGMTLASAESSNDEVLSVTFVRNDLL